MKEFYEYYPKKCYSSYEIEDHKEIKDLYESKSCATWGAGEIPGTIYFKLAQFSPGSYNEKVVIVYCKTSLLKTVLTNYEL